MKAVIFGKKIDKDFLIHFWDLINSIECNQIEYLIFQPLSDHLSKVWNLDLRCNGTFSKPDEIPLDTDIVFSIGGDGTFLEAVSFVREKGIPIVGVNTGRLGFLADIPRDQIPQGMNAIINKEFDIEERSLIKMETNSEQSIEFPFAMNEMTCHKMDTSSMITIHTYIDGEFLNSYWADGLIIATPTGSTAYSLSAGGPILTPSSTNFIITPLAPHNLTVRPLVIQDDHVIKMVIEGRGVNYLATLDSHSYILPYHVEITLRKAEFSAKIIKLKTHSYFSTLRNKLMWGADRRN